MAIKAFDAFIKDAMLYNSPLVATPLPICKIPQEGFKCVPMQFTFAQKANWLVDLTKGTTQAPLSQIASIYIDASQCAHDVNIIFPDTGFQIRCGSLNSVLAPVLCAAGASTFILAIVDPATNTLSSVNTTDLVNIFIMNQFIPEFSCNSFIHNISYGWSEFFTLKPIFSQSSFFHSTFQSPAVPPALDLSVPRVILQAMDYYVTAINANCIISSAVSAGYELQIFAGNGSSLLYSKVLTTDGINRAEKELINLNGLNLRVTNIGPLTALLTNSVAATDYVIEINIQGGILVP